jgi:hypothetical protein
MEPEAKKQRFAGLSTEEIETLVDNKDSENTKKATKNAITTLEAFCQETSTENPEQLSKEELDNLLLKFYPNARKKNGEYYKKSALVSIRFGLQRYFMKKGNFDIINDGDFSKSNKVFEATVVELKRQGYGKVEHHDPISKEDLEKIQLSFNHDSPDPKRLQQVVWFNIMLHLIRRGRENLRQLTKHSFAINTDATGRRFVYQAIDELDKNHRGKDNPDDSTGEGRMYERPESSFCPVKLYELYVSKLNPEQPCLWQRPKQSESFQETDAVWYCNAPLGKNTLGTLMSSMSKELKLSKVYTNHCIRATAVSLLDECNFEARHIMRVSGHKSESSIRSYSRRLSEVKQKEISESLSKACFTSSECTSIVPAPRSSTSLDQPRSCPQSPILMQNYASQSQETVTFQPGAFSGANVTINFYSK